LGVWTPRGLQDSTPGTGTWRAFTRAVVGCSNCCLLEETTNAFLIRMMPMWNRGRAHRGRDVEVRSGNPSSGWSAVDVTSQAGFLAGRPSSPGKRVGRGRRFLDDPRPDDTAVRIRVPCARGDQLSPSGRRSDRRGSDAPKNAARHHRSPWLAIWAFSPVIVNTMRLYQTALCARAHRRPGGFRL